MTRSQSMWASPGLPRPDEGYFLTITTALIAPTSRTYPLNPQTSHILTTILPGGFVTITSSDPFAKPIINPHYLTSTFDIFALMSAVGSVKRYMAGTAWSDYIAGPYGDLAHTDTDEELEAFVRNNAASIYHPLATASMSPRGARWGVVDPDLKVKGVEGLRIVDGSVMVKILCSLELRIRLLLTVFLPSSRM